MIVAGLITRDSEIHLHNVGLNATRTGLLEALLNMGAEIEVEKLGENMGEPYGKLTVRSSKLVGTRIAGDLVVRMIDEFPAFSVAAAFAEGQSQVKDAIELRFKESDRIKSLCEEFAKVGVNIQEEKDGFTIQGRKNIQGGKINPHGDHRLAMAGAILGLASEQPVIVQNAEIIAESFPNFTSTLENLGAMIEELPLD